MSEGNRRVLITGISGQLGGHVARQLEQDDRVEYLVGIDNAEPHHELERTEFVRTDLRNPLVARVIQASGVDTIIHLDTVTGPTRIGGRARMKEHNVLGTMQLFASAQHAPALKKIVLKSTTAVYGSDAGDPAMFTEDTTPRNPPTDGYGHDAVEIEGYARSLGRRRREVGVTVLRFANFIGGRMDSTIGSFFSLPVVPVVMGFDPRLQFCHEEDATEVLHRAVVEDHHGIYNVAGPGVVYLSQCIRLAGRIAAPVPEPAVSLVGSAVRRSRRVDFSPEQLRFLKFGRAGDITRLRDNFGYQPRYSSREAFENFVARRRISGLVNREEVVRWERELYDFIARKGQERFVAARRGM